jgi:hypothetical protein
MPVKEKSHMIISNDVEKIWQNSTPLIINAPKKLGREEDHEWQTYSQQQTKWWKIEIISAIIKNRAKLSILTTLIQYIIGIPGENNQTGVRNKRDSNKE